MGSFLEAEHRKEKKLSSEGVVPALSSLRPALISSQSTPSVNFHTGSDNGSSLDNYKKKVGQAVASRCENPQGAYFICEHGHPIFRSLSCHARFEVDCPHCARRWRRRVKKNFSKRVSQMEFPAFVSLTLKKPSAHSLDELNNLAHRCRKYLRREGCKGCTACNALNGRERRKRHKNCERRKSHDIRGCVSCLDPPNHVHCIWDCDYIPQKKLSETWKLVTGDSFIVDIRKVEKQRWQGAVNELAKYISKISRGGSCVGLSGVHVIISWGDGGYYKKIRMVCKICGSFFEPLWFCGQVDDFDNDPVDFVEIDPG